MGNDLAAAHSRLLSRHLPQRGVDRPQQMTFTREEIEPWDELEALRRKSQAPCDRHEGGGCTCGKAPRNNNKN